MNDQFEHSTEYVKTPEDYLYTQGWFAGIYGAGNFIKHAADPKNVRAGILAAGPHQLVPGGSSNFLGGVLPGVKTAYDKTWSKTIGRTGIGKKMASPEGFNFAKVNFKYLDAKAVGGIENEEALLSGLNFSFQFQQERSRMAKIGVDKMYDKALSTSSDTMDELIKRKEAVKSVKANTIGKGSKAVNKEILSEKHVLLQELEEKIKLKSKEVTYSNITDDLAKVSKKDRLIQASEKATELVGKLDKDSLAKIANLGEGAVAKDIEEVAAKKIGKQMMSDTFKKTVGGKMVGVTAAGIGKTAAFFFSAPVQLLLGAEAVQNTANQLRNDWRLKQVDSMSKSRNAYFSNPNANVDLQKGNFISQRNSTELDSLLAAPNVAKNVARRF